jgi:hypothetical protein
VAVILAVAGVFGGGSTHTKITHVKFSAPSPARLAAVPPSASATAVSLERATALSLTQGSAASSTTPPVTATP